MTLFRRLVFLGCLLIASTSGAWAQSIPVWTGASALMLNGATLQITSCTLNGGACTASDGLTLEGLTEGKDLVGYELLGGSTLSLAKSNSASASLTFAYTITTNQPITATFGNGSATLNGTTSASSTHHVVADEAFTQNGSHTPPTGLTGFNLFLSNSATSQSLGPTGFSQPETNSFTITDTINLSGSSASTVSLTSLVNVFHTAPEPASIAVLTVALGGLAAVRRRRAPGDKAAR